MGFSLVISTPLRHQHSQMQANPPPHTPRPSTARRNASKTLPTVAALHQRRGRGEEVGPNLGRRALLSVGLVGSSLLSLQEAVAGVVGAEDGYQEVTYRRRRLRKETRKEYNSPSVGGVTTESGSRAARLDDAATNVIDGPYSSANRGQGTRETDEIFPSSSQSTTNISEKMFSSTQNVTDMNNDISSSTRNVTVIKQEMPSLTQNSTETRQEILSPGLPKDELTKNPSLSILNTVGILGSGVLGGLYLISLREREEINANADKMKSLLEEKEVATVLLKKDFESKLLIEKEQHRKQFKALEEGEAAIARQLASANATISTLGRELQSEKSSAEKLKLQLDQLNAEIYEASKEKRELERLFKEKMQEIDVLQDRVSLLGFNIKEKDKGIEELSTTLAKKRSECEKLKHVLDQTKADYQSSCTSLQLLKDEVAKANEEIALKNSTIVDLERGLKLITVERDTAINDVDTLQKQYRQLEKESAQKADLDSKLLSKKDGQLQQLEERLKLSLKEMEEKRELAMALTKEKEGLEVALREEMDNVKNLQNEIQTKQASLEAAKLASQELSNLLTESRNTCEDLKSEFSRVKAEFSKEQEVLASSLNEARALSDKSSNELVISKKNLNATMQELLVVTNELKASSKACERLKAEVLEANGRAEAATHELQAKGEIIANLHKDLEDSRRQIAELLEARSTFESGIGKASESLNEMNKKALLLAQELENAQSMNLELEREKERLQDALVEQRNETEKTLEKIEDVQRTISIIGAERECLANENETLEKEITSAKGEILHLKRLAGAPLNAGYNVSKAAGSPQEGKRDASRRKKHNHITE